jgi:hypothetical protein
MQTLLINQVPEIARLIRAVAPSYRKKSVRVSVRESVTLHGTYWDGGSRSVYSAVEIATGRHVSAPNYAPAAFGGPQSAPVVAIPEGVAIVETGVFMGKPSTACVYLNPRNASPLLAV